jgi:hypothetical protein
MIENDRFTALVFFLIGGKLAVLIGRQLHFIILKVVQQLVALSIILVPRDVHLYNKQ